MKKLFSLLLVFSLFAFLVGCSKEEKIDYDNLSDKEFLVEINTWESKSDSSVKIKFNEDGSGEILSGSNILNMNWFYDDGVEDTLVLQSNVNSRDLLTDCIVRLDKENVSMELIDLSNEKSVKYVKSESQKMDEKEYIKDKNIVGVWYSSDFDFNSMKLSATAISLQDDNKMLSGRGEYDISKNEVDAREVFVDWYTDGNKIKLILHSGVIYEYTYKINDESFSLYDGDKLIMEYTYKAYEGVKVK